MKLSTAAKNSKLTTQSPTLTGTVVRTESGFHRVLVGDRTIVARLPKRLLTRQQTTTTPVVIGDRVHVRELDDGSGMIEEILPRENELVRGSAGGGRFLDVIAANLDQLLVVHSLKQPDFNPGRIDRFLLIAEAAEITPVLILNKLDLASREEAEEAAAIYRGTGYPVLLTSALNRAGIEDVSRILAGKESALVGPSGAGKSSLLNDIQPGLGLRTKEISGATGKGRHTTTTAELLSLDAGGWVADTPGLRELAIRQVEPQELEWLFPEFRPLQGQCRFRDCMHREEIGCAVRDAVERGAISTQRYRSYRRVYEHLEEQLPF